MILTQLNLFALEIKKNLHVRQLSLEEAMKTPTDCLELNKMIIHTYRQNMIFTIKFSANYIALIGNGVTSY